MFLRRSLTYGVGTALSKVVSLLLVPLYTRLVDVEALGRADLAISLTALLTSMVFAEAWTALLRNVVGRMDSPSRIDSEFTRTVLLMILLLPVLVFLQYVIAVWTGTGLFVWSVIYAIGLAVNNVWQSMARGLGNSGVFVVSGVVSSSIQAVVALVLLFWVNFGAATMVLAPAIGYFGSAVFLESRLAIRRYFTRIKMDADSFLRIAVFGFPLAANSAAFWLLMSFNTLYVSQVLGFAYSGLIAVAVRFASVHTLVTGVLSLAWQESAYASDGFSVDVRAAYYSEMWRSFAVSTGGLAVLLIVLAPLLMPMLVGPSFAEAAMLLPLYVVGAFVSGCGTFVAQIFAAERRTGLLMVSTMAGAAANVSVLLILIPQLGMVAAPLSMLIGQVVSVVVRFVNARRIIGMVPCVPALTGVALLLGGALGAYYRLHPGPFFWVCCALLVCLWVLMARDILVSLGRRVLAALRR